MSNEGKRNMTPVISHSINDSHMYVCNSNIVNNEDSKLK